ncbi:MAG: hypothetical protein ACUVRV_08175 [Cyanobacteriota bacterium]
MVPRTCCVYGTLLLGTTYGLRSVVVTAGTTRPKRLSGLSSSCALPWRASLWG